MRSTDLISLFTDIDPPRVTLVPSLLSVEDISDTEIDSSLHHTSVAIVHGDDIVDIDELDLSSIVPPPLKKRKCRFSEACCRQNR